MKIVDNRQVPYANLLAGETFELLGNWCDDCDEVLLKTNNNTNLEGKTHTLYVNLATGNTKYLAYNVDVRRVFVTLEVQ